VRYLAARPIIEVGNTLERFVFEQETGHLVMQQLQSAALDAEQMTQVTLILRRNRSMKVNSPALLASWS